MADFRVTKIIKSEAMQPKFVCATSPEIEQDKDPQVTDTSFCYGKVILMTSFADIAVFIVV